MKLDEIEKLILGQDTPFIKTYKKEKISIKKRQTSLDILKKLKEKNELKNVRPGNIYLFSYNANEVPTDKWHRICIVYVTYVSNSSFEGYNLLYFNENIEVGFLKYAEKFLKDAFETQKYSFIKEDTMLSGLICTKKEYNNRNVAKISLIEEELWGKLPCLKREVFGNINFNALELDWKIENRTISPIKKKVKKKPTAKGEEEVIVTTEDVDVFDGMGATGATGATLFDIKRDLFDDDYDI